ncbi:5,6-dimethylbenzimidazole synthase [Pleionea mediterranea]|uniref:Cob(II)yrinic acid a,c-diamide reductase n=1 Tax=Pleionea mediterranea TaxID=523701 RepID=A0A316FLQ1_9GAMM|nr:5,6-dimethylbenzimidazole synthase [Pleionea mediterranea]PWK48650.1 cob(II)yrinic acid a,c-diamide reductase [Pleionea mediterranea]
MTRLLFDQTQQQCLEDIMRLRRDVRGNYFTSQPINDSTLDQLFYSASLAPSVGFSQPWEFVVIRNSNTRQAIANNFAEENEKAFQHFSDEKLKQYQQLKLEGITEAPVNVAVFYKPSNTPVLGQTSMTEMGEYSVVCAVQNIWLMARSMNIGVGWVSILDPEFVKTTLKVPSDHKLIAYLCIGHVSEFLDKPELEKLNWEKRKQKEQFVFSEEYGS